MIRQEFPIFSSKELIYLDSAATTQKPHSVIKSIEEYYLESNANVHRGAYKLAQKATDLYERTRKAIKGFIHAASEQEIIFTRGTTESINLVAYSYLDQVLKKGDNVIISAMEHHSNLVPWQAACKRKHAELRIIPMNQAGELDMETFSNLLDNRTKMVAVVHISNSLGTVNPIEKIIQLAHQQGVPVLVDAAQSIAHTPIDVQTLDCDFLAFSGHKMYGPTGIGILYGKKHLLETMEPWQFGGEMIRMVRFEETTFNQLPYKFEAGTPNIAGAAGLGAAVQFINQLDRTEMESYLKKLRQYAENRLREIPGVKIIGTAQQKSGIISFTYKRVHPHDISTIFDEKHIAVRSGHHCCQPVMQFYQIPGTTRISLGMYNTEEDIDKMVGAFPLIKKIFG